MLRRLCALAARCGRDATNTRERWSSRQITPRRCHLRPSI
jgi:hypothetical protein